MAPRKRKTLPEDFATQLATKSVDELKSFFDTTELNAYSRSGTHCALAFAQCPDELTRWLVEQGLDVDTPDRAGWTPLASRAGTKGANLEILLELGAKIDGGSGGQGGGVPLIHAAHKLNLEHVRFLIEHGADPLAVSCVGPGGHNALETAVSRCDRRHIERGLPVVEYLAGLTRPARGASWRRVFGSNRPTAVYPLSAQLSNSVCELGMSLERLRFALATNADPTDGAEELRRFEAGVQRLYELFHVPPVGPIPVVCRHDGASRIEITGANLDAQYTQLWKMLVPPVGPAATVQGEVIRIVGRLRHEIEGNGGANWDRDFKAMQDALVSHLASERPVSSQQLAEVRAVVAASRGGGGWDSDFEALDRAAVAWVRANPDPIPLPAPSYAR